MFISFKNELRSLIFNPQLYSRSFSFRGYLSLVAYSVNGSRSSSGIKLLKETLCSF